MPGKQDFLGIFLVGLIAAFGCDRGELPPSEPYVDDEPQVLADVPQVDRVKQWKERVVVYPAAGTHWRQLVDLSLFEGLRPGISIEDARDRWGKPNSEDIGPRESSWRFEREDGLVEILFQVQSSPPFPSGDKWFLSGIPSSTDPREILHPAVLEKIPESRGRLKVVIMREQGGPGARVVLEDGQVREVTWVSPGR